MEPERALSMVRITAFVKLKQLFRVHADDAIPLFFCHAHQQGVVGDACIVDDNVHGAKRFDRFSNQPLRVRHARRIRLKPFDSASAGTEFFLKGGCGLRRAAVGERHFGALGNELFCNGFSDAT